MDAELQAENAVLMYNVCLGIMDQLQIGNAEKLAVNLYKLLTSTAKDSKVQVQQDLTSVKKQLLPLVISLNLLAKNPSSASFFLNEAEANAKHGPPDEAFAQRLQLCRALALVQAKNHKGFKRDLKANGLSATNQITLEFLRANMEFIRVIDDFLLHSYLPHY